MLEIVLCLGGIGVAFCLGSLLGYICAVEDNAMREHRERLKNLKIF